MTEATTIMHLIIASIGMLYIFFKAGEWIISMVAKEWCKRRKESVKQKAVNDLYDAFELGKITSGETLKIAREGAINLVGVSEVLGRAVLTLCKPYTITLYW